MNPAATETCDGVDDDCDGTIDEPDASDATTWYADADADGWGDSTATTVACAAPTGAVASAGDCDDTDPTYHPGAEESDCADPNDYNCDGSVAFADADADGFPACAECDDADPAVNPAATETCDGVDDDCDGTIDEPDAVDATTWYADADADGWGDGSTANVACTAPTGFVATPGDCDDTDPAYHPGAEESDCADPHDYNCDGSVAFADADADGFAACEECDDADPAVNPAAVESCNALDDDCDGTIDEPDAVDAPPWYADADGDGWGDSTATTVACTAPTGFVATPGDCDDTDPAYHPTADESDCTDPHDYNCDGSVAFADADADGFPACAECDDADPAVNPAATETCDGVDDDCDGTIDEPDASDASTWYADADGDGFGDPDTPTRACAQPAGFVPDSTDCDDLDTATYPGAVESCNAIDDDCDGTTDEPDAVDASTWYADSDGDGYGDLAAPRVACDPPTGFVTDATDCDDGRDASNPGAIEYCDGEDDDCDGTTDEPDAADAPTWYADSDGDGFGDAASSTRACTVPDGFVPDASDCDDGEVTTNPDALEHCDGEDDDCDGTTDEPDAVDASTWYADSDADGYGDLATSRVACDPPTGFVADASDCDDGRDASNPGAVERCNGEDDDCDGTTDEPDAVDAPTWYADSDADGYGDPTVVTPSCAALVPGWVANDDDCDDGTGATNPAASETCDAVDNDCDGAVDEADAVDGETWFLDADDDGYGDEASTTEACDPPTGYTDDATDCDDASAAVYPGAPEVCNGVDDDCDGVSDDGVAGSSSTCPGTSCLDILSTSPGAASGTYYLQPSGAAAPFAVECDMTKDGGGWTQLTSSYLATLASGVTREYLYTYGSGWYVSPETTYIWSWSSYQVLPGTYSYASGGSTLTGSFSCSHGEGGHWGIGCSNGGGRQWKVLPWGSSKDSTNGYSQICQDLPDVFGVGACAYPARIWVRP